VSETWESLGVRKVGVPRAPLTDAERARLGLPATFRRIDDEDALQQPLFDPALKHHRNAYRAGDPAFVEPASRTAWLAARRTAMDFVLSAVAASPWRDHLVLRGSVLLTRWFGEAAREPGDLDFVVTPAQWRIEEERTTVMLDDIARAAERAASVSAASPPVEHAVRFDTQDAVSEDIWTYDRVPGRRLVLPWTCDTTPGGIVQLDFVFNESLPVPPQEVTVGASLLLGATPELSLAWKLVWLVTDIHPQGKDLYDAVLLAEHCEVDYETLGAVFIAADPYYAAQPVGLDVTTEMSADTEWRHFAAEYPHLAGDNDPSELVRRLRAALAPTFRTTSCDPRALRSQWSAQWLSTCRAVYATGGLHALLTDLAAKQTPAAVAAAVTRELLGPDTCDPAQAVSHVIGHTAWSTTAEHFSGRPESLRRLIEAVSDMDIGV
jgi:hypothetical protein